MAISFDEHAELVQRRDGRQVVFLAEGVVFLACAGRGMHEPGAVVRADLIPQDDSMFDAALSLKIVERSIVPQAVQLGALHLLYHLVLGLQHLQPAPQDVQSFVAAVWGGSSNSCLHVCKIWMDCDRYVRSESPGGRRPDQERFAWPVDQGEPDVEAGVRDVLIALGDDFVMRDAGSASGAPRHYVASFVDIAIPMADLEEVPDGVVVLVRHGVVGVVPVHPVSEANRLASLDVGEPPHALLAQLHEFVDAEVLNVRLGLHTQISLDVDLDPQALPVKSILVALLEALHRLVALEDVLVGTPPSVVNSHRVVGGDGAVHEREPLVRSVVAMEVLVDDAMLVPPRKQVFLHLDEINLGRYGLEQLPKSPGSYSPPDRGNHWGTGEEASRRLRTITIP